MKKIPKEEYDIIILGAGLVGLVAAELCAHRNLSVALVEAHTPCVEWDTSQEGLSRFDIRCSAITRSSQQVFQTLGLWESMINLRVSPYYQMIVWDALGFGEIKFNAAEINEPNLGYIIENRIMLKILWENLSNYSNIDVFTHIKTEDLIQEESYILLKLENNTILKSKLIVGADGAKSWLREQLKIKTTKRDYHQNALIATVKTEKPHQETAFQRFLPEGPLAFLPLSDPHVSSIVWSTTPEKTKEYLTLSPEHFCAELSHQLDYHLGKVVETGERRAFPLSMQHVQNYTLERVAFIGDAAHVIHPLAGQGLNLGFSDAQVLSEVLANAKKENCDIGHRLILRKFERVRKARATQMIGALDFLKNLFGFQFSSAVYLRSIGLNVVNKVSFLKKKLMTRALYG